jgi:TolB protein
VWAIDTRTGKETLLLDFDLDIGWPKISPDGKTVVFNSTKGGTINIWSASIGGGQPQQLTKDKELMGFACWSPDGKLLAFEIRRGNDENVAVMPATGGPVEQLTSVAGQSWPHSWSPDGSKIAFAGQRDGVWNVYWVSRTTKEQKQLTHYTKLNTFVRYPAWSPLGNQIIYEYAESTGNIWLLDLK